MIDHLVVVVFVALPGLVVVEAAEMSGVRLDVMVVENFLVHLVLAMVSE